MLTKAINRLIFYSVNSERGIYRGQASQKLPLPIESYSRTYYAVDYGNITFCAYQCTHPAVIPGQLHCSLLLDDFARVDVAENHTVTMPELLEKNATSLFLSDTDDT